MNSHVLNARKCCKLPFFLQDLEKLRQKYEELSSLLTDKEKETREYAEDTSDAVEQADKVTSDAEAVLERFQSRKLRV